MEILNSREIKETLANAEVKLKKSIYGYVTRYADLVNMDTTCLVTKHYHLVYNNGVVINDQLMVYSKEKGCATYLYSMSVTELLDVLSDLEEAYAPKIAFAIQVIHNGDISERGLYQRYQTAKVDLDELANTIFAEVKAKDDRTYIEKEYDRGADVTESDMREEYGRDFVDYPIKATIRSKDDCYTISVIEKLLN